MNFKEAAPHLTIQIVPFYEWKTNPPQNGLTNTNTYLIIKVLSILAISKAALNTGNKAAFKNHDNPGTFNEQIKHVRSTDALKYIVLSSTKLQRCSILAWSLVSFQITEVTLQGPSHPFFCDALTPWGCQLGQPSSVLHFTAN